MYHLHWCCNSLPLNWPATFFRALFTLRRDRYFTPYTSAKKYIDTCVIDTMCASPRGGKEPDFSTSQLHPFTPFPHIPYKPSKAASPRRRWVSGSWTRVTQALYTRIHIHTHRPPPRRLLFPPRSCFADAAKRRAEPLHGQVPRFCV